MNEEKNQKIFAIVLVIAVIGLGIYKLFFNNKRKIVIDTETISIVKDNSRFFTVSNCVTSYIGYLNAKDTDSLLILLNSNYKKENNIDANNLYQYTGELDENYFFSAKKMYEQRLSKTMYKYYVYGTLEDTIIDEHVVFEYAPVDYYIIVILDESNTTYSIEPYDGEIFNK